MTSTQMTFIDKKLLPLIILNALLHFSFYAHHFCAGPFRMNTCIYIAPVKQKSSEAQKYI